MSDFILWRDGNDWSYALSTASTWIWAPALFVASSISHTSGIYGLLWFLIPNVLTLMIFGWLASRFVKNNGYNITHALGNACKGQKSLHRLMSFFLLVMSTVVQLVGLHTLFTTYFDVSKIVTIIVALCGCSAIVWTDGIKACIRTDVLKYAIIAIGGAFLASYAVIDGRFQGWQGVNSPSFVNVSLSFGITTAIGLFAAPYVDNTFWQRAFCLDRPRRFRVFVKSAIAFAVIPTLFAIIGFFSDGGSDWQIGMRFPSGLLAVILSVSVLMALVSTIDSNLCAMASLYHDKNNCGNEESHVFMISLFAIAAACFYFSDLSIVEWFLFYGTARTCIAVPTIFILTNHYSDKRLFLSTFAAVLISTIGYYMTSSVVFTLIALLLPCVGYSKERKVCDISLRDRYPFD